MSNRGQPAVQTQLKSPLYKRLGLVLKSPSMVMFVISLIVLLINVAYIGKIRPFDSDDLYWQLAVRTWQPFSGHTVYLGTGDTFVGIVPFLYIMEHLFSPSRKLLIAEAGILTAVSFAGLYWSGIYFLKKLNVKLTYLTLLPFVWLASLGFAMVENYLNIDWRTFEIGFSFLTFVGFAAILHKEINIFSSYKTKLLTLLVLVCEGVLMYGDPYYLYFTFGPILLFVILLYALKKIDRKLLLTILGLAIISEVLNKAVGVFSKAAGIVVTGAIPSTFVSIDNIVTNILTSIHGLLIAFGADLSNRPIGGRSTIVALLNFCIVGLIVYKLFALRGLAQRPTIQQLKLSQLWLVFLGGVILMVFLVYTISTLDTLYNYRYLFTLIFASSIFLAAVVGTSANRPLRIIVGCVLVGSIICNMGLVLFTRSVANQFPAQGPSSVAISNIGNALNFKLIQTIESQGLTKGYANYWQANVNTYLANRNVTFLPALCSPTGYATDYHWLLDGSRFNIHANRSFFLYDPDIPDPATCTIPQLISQFGRPAKELSVSDKTILIYNYDISTKLHPEVRSY